MKTLMMVTLVAVACCLVGCDGGSSGTLDPLEPTVRVTAADLGSTVNIHVGETVQIALGENPSTGSSWHCTWDPAGDLTLAADDYVPSGGGGIGGGGTRTFLLEGASPGTVVVTVQVGQWWPGGAVGDPQTLTVNVWP